MLPAVAVDKLLGRMRELLQTVTDPGLATLAECYLMDENLMERLCLAPAGLKTHHAYPGGLLEHVVTLMDVASRISPCYPMIDRDLLVVGALVHDISKVDELDYDREIGYTDEGQLIGHLVMGVRVLEDKVEEAEKLSGEPLDQEKLLRLKHIVISHHGQYEFGSPKLPMTLEAVTLAFLDNMDAKIAQFHQHMQDDPNHQSSWTVYNPNLQRKLFKGKPKKDDGVD
jgi:3'-5' exoribonuclease